MREEIGRKRFEGEKKKYLADATRTKDYQSVLPHVFVALSLLLLLLVGSVASAAKTVRRGCGVF